MAPTSGTTGGTPEGQFFFSLTTSFIGRPGGGFQGGAVVGGYHATHPFGGVSGFAAFCLATPHSTSVRVLSQPSYGAAGAKDLRLRIQDAQQRNVIVVPGDIFDIELSDGRKVKAKALGMDLDPNLLRLAELKK